AGAGARGGSGAGSAAGSAAGQGLELVLQWRRVDVMRMSDGTEAERRRPLTAEDLGQRGPVHGDPDVVALAAAVAGAGWPWIIADGSVRISGRDAGLVLTDGIEQLGALDGIRVTVLDGVPQIRRASEGPRIHVATEDDRSGIDWLGLTVSVTVEGRPVPFAEVFRAVVTGQEEFI